MLRFTLVLLFALTAVHGQQPNPNLFCFECAGQRNQKDLYANPEDCHTYYQCFYPKGIEGDEAIGFLRHCPSGMFWYDGILSCVPEGPVACQDLCQDQATNIKGCYADPTRCSAFFVCSYGVGRQMCCPPKTAFNNETCACDESDTCTTPCSMPSPVVSTERTPAQVFDTFCVDSFGNTLRAGSTPDFYVAVDTEDDTRSVERPCAMGTQFSLEACECAVPVNVTAAQPNTFCDVYVPFDGDTLDHGFQKIYIDVVNADLDMNVAAKGSGSLRLQPPNGRVELPAAKTFTYFSYTMCVFFRCPNPPCNYDAASLISQCNAASYGKQANSMMASVQAGNNFRLERWCDASTNSSSEFLFPPFVDTNEFTQLCFERSRPNKVTRIYVNGVMVGEAPDLCSIDNIPLNHCSCVFGYDPMYGGLDGYVDEILFCNRELGVEGVGAHFSGKQALMDAGLIPPSN